MSDKAELPPVSVIDALAALSRLGGRPGSQRHYQIVHSFIVAQSKPKDAEICGSCGKAWDGQKCAQAENGWPVCYPCPDEQQARVPEGWPAKLSALRADGWAVAVHNDYRLKGEPHTFWLFTRGGQAIKGEGRTDDEALGAAMLAAAPQPPAGAVDERAEFERHIRALNSKCPPSNSFVWRSKDQPWFSSYSVRSEWLAWQARAALRKGDAS